MPKTEPKQVSQATACRIEGQCPRCGASNPARNTFEVLKGKKWVLGKVIYECRNCHHFWVEEVIDG